MTKEFDETKSNIKHFKPKAKKTPEFDIDTLASEELLEKGLEIFVQELSNNGKGFLSIVFDQDNYPQIIWAGDIDMVASLGALELAKNELYTNAIIDLG